MASPAAASDAVLAPAEEPIPTAPAEAEPLPAVDEVVAVPEPTVAPDPSSRADAVSSDPGTDDGTTAPPDAASGDATAPDPEVDGDEGTATCEPTSVDSSPSEVTDTECDATAPTSDGATGPVDTDATADAEPTGDGTADPILADGSPVEDTILTVVPTPTPVSPESAGPMTSPDGHDAVAVSATVGSATQVATPGTSALPSRSAPQPDPTQPRRGPSFVGPSTELVPRWDRDPASHPSTSLSTTAISGAGLMLITPRVPSSVSVAIDFARAGSGWAGPLVFSAWLRRQLRERRISQRQLAQHSGVNHSTISRLLTGTRSPSLRTATKIVHALRMSWTDEQVAAYFDLLPDSAMLPTQRVETALRGDGSLSDNDVRSVMDMYLVLRARRRRDGGRSREASGE